MTQPPVHQPDADAASAARFSMGDDGFDTVLNGGMPRDTLCMLIGPPGTGKTVAALQMAFVSAQQGYRVVYLTTASESHLHLIKHVRMMEFFDEQMLSRRLSLVSISRAIYGSGPETVLDFILDVVRTSKADLLIIDSYLGLKQLFAIDIATSRTLLFSLTTRLALMAVTTVLVGEYQSDAMYTEPEFAISDVIIELAYRQIGLQSRRHMRVLKLRGSAFLEGLHTVVISDSGITIYPRLETVATRIPAAHSSDQRMSLGVRDLDTMLVGGVLAGSTTLITGASGVGKTLLGLHFLAAGAPNEPGMIVTFQETPAQLEHYGHDFGLITGPDLATSRIHVLSLAPTELVLDVVGHRIREAIQQNGIRRIVIDSIDELERATQDSGRVHQFLSALLILLGNADVTTVLIRDLTNVHGTHQGLDVQVLFYSVDTIISMQYIEQGPQRVHALAVIKQRGSSHDHRLRQISIADHTIRVGDAITGGRFDHKGITS